MLNIQPVIPVRVGNWNLINRPILPLIDQPVLVPGQDDETGIGDLNYQLFISPAGIDLLVDYMAACPSP